ncbi:hypothetical protein OAG68_00525 [bacterium]|nr:hypothetical protein [bacterium]
MKLSTISLSLLWFITLLPLAPTSGFGQQLDEEQFQKLHAELKPTDEAWKEIPWQTNLLEAQRIAAEAQKPIFIWAMDGHPLGCT